MRHTRMLFALRLGDLRVQRGGPPGRTLVAAFMARLVAVPLPPSMLYKFSD
jgi:hypothetical protein